MLGAKEFVGATHNRVAFCYMDKEEWKDALLELQEAERISSGVEAESAILSTTLAYRASVTPSSTTPRRRASRTRRALKYAMASGNEGVVREAENFLAETQDQSAIDDSAPLMPAAPPRFLTRKPSLGAQIADERARYSPLALDCNEHRRRSHTRTIPPTRAHPTRPRARPSAVPTRPLAGDVKKRTFVETTSHDP